MPSGSHAGLAHIRAAKNSSQSQKEWVKKFDKLLVVIALLGPAATIPQILKIFSEKNAQGLSIISWGIFLVLSVPWIVYGLVHKEKPIFIAYIFYFLTNLLVVAGIILYS